ncbi:hypothetical protein KXD40_001304 [Peronospora effusa]|uniref:Uncharacterized protein n=1 Tax=Peronospora effusa TaxID=542832 RepID=A0A3M6VLR4_9STRA|nr:hypothetical protein DD238_000320 [Peronospora effusa]UIZ21669.1 hypothetical protein KXD40_001304 [Peronospora effusa]CAI5704251.1 unnamed protein product [Peronospora effusa]
MSSAQSQNDVASPVNEQSMDMNEQKLSTAATCAPHKKAQMTRDHHLHDVYVAVDALDSGSPSKKRRRIRRDKKESILKPFEAAFASQKHKLSSLETIKDSGEVLEENRYVDDKKDVPKETLEDVREVSVNEELENNEELMSQSLGDEEKGNETCGDVLEEKQKKLRATDEMSTREETESFKASVPSQAGYIYGVNMVFPEDEVPIELCPFSSDGSVDPTHEESLPRTFNNAEKASPKVASAPRNTTPPILPGILVTPTVTAPTTPAFMTTKDSATQIVVKRPVGRRRRRKKLSYSFARNKAATKKAKQEHDNVPASTALEGTLITPVNGHSAENGVEDEVDSTAPPSPVYPNAGTSYLYPSTSKGAPWQWKDVEMYFDPVAQSDLDTLIRWRRENANFIAANPKAWRGVSGMESKRALLETMVADASDALGVHVDFPIRRGRSYLDIWEEIDFLDQQKRDSSLGETQVTSQVVKMKKKRKKVIMRAETSLLVSHRDLVYGYDDDRFQDFRDHLACRVKACQSDLPPTTPPMPSIRRQQNTNTEVVENVAQSIAEEVEFDEEVLPTFPICQLHPASLGLWKLRRKQDPDYSVVHPASVNRSQVPARWKEEMEHHKQQQYELQLQQMDKSAHPIDDDRTSDSTRDRLHVTISNRQVTGKLPSFGNSVEEDEISQTLAASVRSLISLSIYNWRTAQIVYERAACSIQCAPILEGEAAVARELEDVFLQLCSPNDTSTDAAVLPGSDLTRLPRTSLIKKSTPHDMIAHSVRHDVADNCSLAVAASVEFALQLSVGDAVDVLDRKGCWNYGEVMETYSEDTLGVATFLLIRFSLWPDDNVEWIAASEGRILPQGVADGSRLSSVGPTRAHRVRIRYDQNLARDLELSFPQRQAKQVTAASQVLAQRQHNIITRTPSDVQKTSQKRKRKRPAKCAVVARTSS